MKRSGIGKLGRLGPEPAVRHECDRPGELIHIEATQLGRIHGGAGKRVTGIKRNPGQPVWTSAAGFDCRIVGWEYVHIAIDDRTRLAHAGILADERAITVIASLKARWRSMPATAPPSSAS